MARADTGDDRNLRQGRKIPYLLSLPGVLFLLLFFIIPMITLFRIALSSRIPGGDGYRLTWEWGNFGKAFDEFGGHLRQAFFFAAIATVLCLLIAYPIAYFIAFKAGRWKALVLGLVMLPFFTSYLLRTFAWEALLADAGPIMRVVKAVSMDGILESVGIMDNGRILQTKAAVIGGLTYNYLPFMLLPIYVSLEKIDVRLIDAAYDLYSTFWRAFRKVIFPLSLPGVFAGTLLTFIPATGDFINARRLGGTSVSVIGNAVQAQFIVNRDYPTAAAMSFVLMAIITVVVLIYSKFLGTEDLT